jgi:signal transduction histidine kinase
MATGKNIELKSFIPETLTFVADKNMIRTILRNLITNAVKFTHKNGQVQVNAINYNDNIEISVSDNGIGMSKETIAKLFRIDANLSTRGTENEKGTFYVKNLLKNIMGIYGLKVKKGKAVLLNFFFLWI